MAVSVNDLRPLEQVTFSASLHNWRMGLRLHPLAPGGTVSTRIR